MDEKEITFIEMFCGVGGFRLGLEKASQERDKESWSDKPNFNRESTTSWGSKSSFSCVWANDNDKYACQIYRERFGDKELIEKNIIRIPTKEIPEHDLLTAGFPCQSFSIAGKRKGFQDKARGTLFYEICRVVRGKRPKYLLLENVKGLLSHDSGRTFAIILLSLDELGYDVEWQVLNTKYWLPQNRERVFIFGIGRKS